MLNVIMLSVEFFMLSVIMLSIVAPLVYLTVLGVGIAHPIFTKFNFLSQMWNE